MIAAGLEGEDDLAGLLLPGRPEKEMIRPVERMDVGLIVAWLTVHPQERTQLDEEASDGHLGRRVGHLREGVHEDHWIIGRG